MEKIFITNKNGEKLAGNYYTRGSSTLLIMCHGFAGSKDYFLFKFLSAEFAKVGVDSFAFDFSGYGESDGVFGESGLLKQKGDLCSVINFFKKYEKIILLGHSMGGAVVILSARCSRLIKGVVLINSLFKPLLSFNSSVLRIYPIVAWSEQKNSLLKNLSTLEAHVKNKILKNVADATKKFINGMGRNTLLGESFFMELAKADIRGAAKKIKVPTLVVHGKMDLVIPVSHAKELYSLLSKPKSLVILNYGHVPLYPVSLKINEEIMKWYRKNF